MDLGSYVLGFGTVSGVVTAWVINKGILDYQERKSRQACMMQCTSSGMEVELSRLAEDINGEGVGYYSSQRHIANINSHYAGEFNNISNPNFNVPRHLRKVFPRYQKAARELRDMLDYLQTNGRK